MKIQVLSDTHKQEYTINREADLIVHAGDFGNGLYDLLAFVELCKNLNKPYVLVLGNHDFYGSSISSVYDKLDSLGINYLKEGKQFVFQGKKFVGGTLFTNFRANKLEPWDVDTVKELSQNLIYDFKAIPAEFIYSEDMLSVSYVTPSDYITMFNTQLNWINTFRNDPDVIVLTHFPMSLACLDPYWGNHPTASCLNPYFINDLDLTGFNLVISGHTHTAVDTVVDGCRVIVNPLGYAKEHGTNGYNSNLILEV